MSQVFLVEDSLEQTQKIKNCLEKEGLTVITAKSAEEALIRIQQKKPDLILLDVILPGQSGFELCRQLKEDPGTKLIPIAICSSKNTDLDRSWGDMSGANAYLTKPIDETKLLETVDRLLG